MDARNSASSIADKYIARDGSAPVSRRVETPKKAPLAIRELHLLQRARLRDGKLPTDDVSMTLAELAAMTERGLIAGPPWRMTADALHLIRPYDTMLLADYASMPLLRVMPRGAAVMELIKPNTGGLVGRTLADVERELILRTYDHCDNDRAKTAKMLDISVRTVGNKLKAYQDGL
jgi:transcriptional regulator with GAF, ATPase, and Fis domain